MSAIPRLRPTPDDAVRRYVEVVRRDLEPDPLFRRRLRGTVVNRFVAQREGVALPITSPLSRQMGRLGRACLYASFALALSVGGVMAASESAIPGDLLYPLKRSIEQMRVEVAPAHLRDELATYELRERIAELSQLVEHGAWATAAAFAEGVEASYEELAATAGVAVVVDDRLEAQLAHLAEVLEGAPVGAVQAIVSAMEGAPGLQLDHPGTGHAGGGPGAKASGQDDDNGSGSNGSSNGSGGNGGNGGTTGSGASNGNGPSGGGASGQAPTTPEPTPTATPAPPAASERPERTPKPERSPKPDPTPHAEGSGES